MTNNGDRYATELFDKTYEKIKISVRENVVEIVELVRGPREHSDVRSFDELCDLLEIRIIAVLRQNDGRLARG